MLTAHSGGKEKISTAEVFQKFFKKIDTEEQHREKEERKLEKYTKRKNEFLTHVKRNPDLDNVIFGFAQIFPEYECPYLRDIFKLKHYDILEEAQVKLSERRDSSSKHSKKDKGQRRPSVH